MLNQEVVGLLVNVLQLEQKAQVARFLLSHLADGACHFRSHCMYLVAHSPMSLQLPGGVGTRLRRGSSSGRQGSDRRTEVALVPN